MAGVLIPPLFRDFAVQPPHPDHWLAVPSKFLNDYEVHLLSDWLWECCRGRWNIVTWYVPELRQLVYFQEVRDAVLFKLTWGGNPVT